MKAFKNMKNEDYHSFLKRHYLLSTKLSVVPACVDGTYITHQWTLQKQNVFPFIGELIRILLFNGSYFDAAIDSCQTEDSVITGSGKKMEVLIGWKYSRRWLKRK